VGDRKRRARHRYVDAERTRRAAHERRLAGAQLAGDEDDVAAAQLARQRGADPLGCSRTGGLEDARRPAQNNPNCSASTASVVAPCGGDSASG
jgi:hypothetical protein